jgi:hypothetical protein
MEVLPQGNAIGHNAYHLREREQQYEHPDVLTASGCRTRFEFPDEGEAVVFQFSNTPPPIDLFAEGAQILPPAN